MNLSRRHPITLGLGLLLIIFSICQAQARLQLPGLPASAAHLGTMPSHHDMPAEPAEACHDHCLTITVHPDNGTTAQLPDLSPVLLIWLDAIFLTDTAAAVARIYQPPDPRRADPPPLLRFQHYLN